MVAVTARSIKILVLQHCCLRGFWVRGGGLGCPAASPAHRGRFAPFIRGVVNCSSKNQGCLRGRNKIPRAGHEMPAPKSLRRGRAWVGWRWDARATPRPGLYHFRAASGLRLHSLPSFPVPPERVKAPSLLPLGLPGFCKYLRGPVRARRQCRGVSGLQGRLCWCRPHGPACAAGL